MLNACSVKFTVNIPCDSHTNKPHTVLTLFLSVQKFSKHTLTHTHSSHIFSGLNLLFYGSSKHLLSIQVKRIRIKKITMNRIVIEVFGFLISTFGWFFVSCTVGMDYWRVSYIGGQGGSWIIKAAWYWSTLWRDCYIDSSDVANCRDFDIMWVVRPGNRSEQGKSTYEPQPC